MINDPAVIKDYQHTHPVALNFTGSRSTSIYGSTTTNITYSNGPPMRFIEDTWGRLRQCTILTPVPIEETFIHDDLGRIREIQREPANWSALWQSATTKAATGGQPPAPE